MTLQQLEYVITVADYHNFSKAAEALEITQSTLSTMIHRLEEELDVIIFDRGSKPIQTTLIGQRIVDQARITVFNAKQMMGLSRNERQIVEGTIKVAFSPTIAPMLVPKVLKSLGQKPNITINGYELSRDNIIHKIKNAELDMGIFSLPHSEEGLLEIPLYTERLFLYVSEQEPLFKMDAVDINDVPDERLWALHNEFGFRQQIEDTENTDSKRTNRYSSGSLATLMYIVNHNDGFTIIPETLLPMLRKEEMRHIRPLTNSHMHRKVSLWVREDYLREGLINILVDAVKNVVPKHLLDPQRLKFPVRLR